MASDAILRTYGDTTVVTDVVLNAITNISAREDFFLKNLGRTQAKALSHSYMVDTYRTAASQAVAQAADYTNLALSVPTLQTNVVEHVAIPFRVSRAQTAVQHYHGQDELARQTAKAMQEFGEAAEFDIVRSTLVSGVSGTVPKMSGILQAISKSTNYTLQTSGTVFSASILNGLMTAQWNNSPQLATDLFMGSYLRNVMDSFSQKSNVVVANLGLTEIVNSVDVYRTSQGKVNVHTHRFVFVSGTDANARVLGVNPDSLKLAFLTMPYIDTTLARSGPYDARAIAGDLTLEVHNKGANFFADGYLAT